MSKYCKLSGLHPLFSLTLIKSNLCLLTLIHIQQIDIVYIHIGINGVLFCVTVIINMHLSLHLQMGPTQKSKAPAKKAASAKKAKPARFVVKKIGGDKNGGERKVRVSRLVSDISKLCFSFCHHY